MLKLSKSMISQGYTKGRQIDLESEISSYNRCHEAAFPVAAPSVNSSKLSI